MKTLAARPAAGDVDARISPRSRLAAYFVISEALTNVAKYAAANRATVRVGRDGSVLVEVSDDGVGGADPAHGSGLRGLGDGLSPALGGKLEVYSRTDTGTTVKASIPCE